MTTTLYETCIPSPIGKLTLIADDKALVGIQFAPSKKRDTNEVLAKATRELEEYFAGKRTRFTLPLAFSGTKLQEKVWRALAEIPFGETRSYGDIAKKVGAPRAFRAVGGCNNRNPLPIVLPCHRVIGKDGSLTGFGGGIPTKQWLLDHESKKVSRRAARGRDSSETRR